MTNRDKEQISLAIRRKALETGFAACGISKAYPLEEDRKRLERWLKKGYHGNMKYLENAEKRADPGQILGGARSVISLAYNYLPEEHFIPKEHYRVARFALGKEYHDPVYEKLAELAEFLHSLSTETIITKVFVDSAPMLERAWARRSRLGWIGKNACLIIPGKGSYFILGEIITDLGLACDEPYEKDLCGKCRLCIDSCPTQAITKARMIDATRCISYITQKPESAVPGELKGRTGRWLYGCDICQEVCPHNQNAKPPAMDWLAHDTRFASLSREDWENMSLEQFERLFEGTALHALGLEGLKRNLSLQ